MLVFLVTRWLVPLSCFTTTVSDPESVQHFRRLYCLPQCHNPLDCAPRFWLEPVTQLCIVTLPSPGWHAGLCSAVFRFMWLQHSCGAVPRLRRGLQPVLGRETPQLAVLQGAAAALAHQQPHSGAVILMWGRDCWQPPRRTPAVRTTVRARRSERQLSLDLCVSLPTLFFSFDEAVHRLSVLVLQGKSQTRFTRHGAPQMRSLTNEALIKDDQPLPWHRASLIQSLQLHRYFLNCYWKHMHNWLRLTEGNRGEKSSEGDASVSCRLWTSSLGWFGGTCEVLLCSNDLKSSNGVLLSHVGLCKADPAIGCLLLTPSGAYRYCRLTTVGPVLLYESGAL